MMDLLAKDGGRNDPENDFNINYDVVSLDQRNDILLWCLDMFSTESSHKGHQDM